MWGQYRISGNILFQVSHWLACSFLKRLNAVIDTFYIGESTKALLYINKASLRTSFWSVLFALSAIFEHVCNTPEPVSPPCRVKITLFLSCIGLIILYISEPSFSISLSSQKSWIYCHMLSEQQSSCRRVHLCRTPPGIHLSPFLVYRTMLCWSSASSDTYGKDQAMNSL